MERQGFDRVLHSGYLNKLGGLTKTAFEKRFFVAADGMLYWFASEKAAALGPSEAKGEMALVGIKHGVLDQSAHGPHCFAITGPSQKQYVLQAASEEDRKKWLVTVSTVNRKVVIRDLAAIEPDVPPPGFFQGDELRTKCIAANLIQCCGVDFLHDEELLLHVMTGITSSASTALMHSNASMKYLVRDCLVLTSHRLLRIDAFTAVATVSCSDIQTVVVGRGVSQILIKRMDGSKAWIRLAKEEDAVHLAKILCALCSQRMWSREGPSVAPREERLFQMRRRHHASAGKVSVDPARFLDMDSYYIVCDQTPHRGLVVSSEPAVGFVGNIISDEAQFVLSEPSNALTQLWRYNSATGRLTSRVTEQVSTGGEEKQERMLQKQDIIVYENQRSYPVIGWKAMFLPTDRVGPWSSEDGSVSALTRELLEVQQQPLIDQQWRWLGTWAPFNADAAFQEENWEYGASFQKNQEFSPKQQSFNCRRRTWKRTLGKFQSGENAPIVVECWENQRFYPVVGWSEKVLPVDPPFWSNRTGTKRASKEDRAPPGWAWVGPWKVSQESKSGKDGWIYGTKDFVGCHHEIGWQSEDLPRTTFVRRRRWVRKQVKVVAVSESEESKSCKMPGWLPSSGWLVQTITQGSMSDSSLLAESSPVCIQSEIACNVTGAPLYFGLEPQSRIPISTVSALEPAAASAGTGCIFQPYWHETAAIDSVRDEMLDSSSSISVSPTLQENPPPTSPTSPTNTSPLFSDPVGFLAPLVRLVSAPIETAVNLLSPRGPAVVTTQFYPRDRAASRIVSPLENSSENVPRWKLLTALQYYIDYDIQPVLDRIQLMKKDEKLKAPTLERIPFDSATFECIWVDSLSTTKMSVWRPDPPKGYVCFGHFVHSSPLPPSPLFAPAIFKDDSAFKPVKSFSLALCLDYGADMEGEAKSLFIWKPEPCDSSYGCLGYVFTTSIELPSRDTIRCFPLTWAAPFTMPLDLVFREEAGRFALWRVPYSNVVVLGCRSDSKKEKKLARIKQVPFGFTGPSDEEPKEALADCTCFRLPLRRDLADSNFWLLKAEALLVLRRTAELLFSLSEKHFVLLEKHILNQSEGEDDSDFIELPYMEAYQLLTGARRLLDFVFASDLDTGWNKSGDSKEAEKDAAEVVFTRDLLNRAQQGLLRYLKYYLTSLTKFEKKITSARDSKTEEFEEDPLVDVVGVLDDAWLLLKSLKQGDEPGWQDIMAILEAFAEQRFATAAEKMSEKVAPSEQDLVVAEEEASKEFLTSIGSALPGLKASEEKEKAKSRAELQARPAVCILLPRLQDLMRDLYVVADARNQELLSTFADFYQTRMQTFFEQRLPPNKLLINHLLQVCAWVTEHADSMETLLGRPTYKKTCDDLQMKYIEQYCAITKPRLIEICSRMLKIVGQVNPPAKRDECFYTNLPIDFMMNLDVVWTHASKFKLKGSPVESIAFMCCEILAYFQEAYSLTLGNIVFEMVDENDEDASVSSSPSARPVSQSFLANPPSPEPGFVRLKSSARPALSHEHLLAAINDILTFRDLFRELQDELEEQIGGDGERLEELEERTSATDAGFLDIAAKYTDKFGTLCWNQHISKFAAVLFTPAWLHQREEVGTALYEALISYYYQFLDGVFEQGKEVLGTRLVRLLITSWTESYIELFLSWCQARVSAGNTAQLDFDRLPPPAEMQKKIEEKTEPGLIDLWLAEEDEDQNDEKVARDIAILKEKMKRGKERMTKGLNSAKKGMKKRAIKLGQIKLGSSPSESTAGTQFPPAATIFRLMKEDGEDACSFFMEYHEVIPERMLASCLRVFTDQCEFLQSVVCSDGNLLRWMAPRGVALLAHIRRMTFRDILLMLLSYRGDLTKEAILELLKPFEGPESLSKLVPKTKQPVAVSDVIKRSRVTSNAITGKAVTLTGLKVTVHSAAGLWIKKVMPNPECKVYLVAPNPPEKNSGQSVKRAFISTKKAISGKAANQLDADNLRMDATVYAVRKTNRAVETGSPLWEETLSFENLLAKNPFLNFDDLAVRLIVWDPRGFGKKKRFLGMVEQRLRAVEQEVVKQQHTKDNGRARYDMPLAQHSSLLSTSKVSGSLSFSVELCHSNVAR